VSERTPPDVVRYGPDDALDVILDDPTVGGTYVVVFELASRRSVEVGALGGHELPVGHYAYVGSALGPGGFGRAERHRRHLDEDDGTVHWHVDALTTLPETSFVAALLVPARDVECAIARRLPPGPIDGFGSSDCGCRSHLSVETRDATERNLTALVGAIRSVVLDH
jgi:endonuclease-3